jgi:hypothetical protein
MVNHVYHMTASVGTVQASGPRVWQVPGAASHGKNFTYSLKKYLLFDKCEYFFRCYVDKSCPGAHPDTFLPGLYYSYDACTDDQDALQRCKWKNKDNVCHNRTVVESSWESTSTQTEIKLSTMIIDGIATFTDLGSVMVGKYKLTVQAQFPSGPLIWKYKTSIAIRPSVARMMKLVQAPAVAIPGSPLQSQPIVQLTDIYGNPVLNDKICTAVTATVASWAGKVVSGLGLESPRRYIYGQKLGDNSVYPYGCSTDPNLLCRFAGY